jgi:hypothetical protein
MFTQQIGNTIMNDHAPFKVSFDPDRDHDLIQKLYELIAKVIVYEDHVYTAQEIELARTLLASYDFNDNVGDFLRVIAGIWVPRNEPIDEAELVFKPRNK